MLNSLSLSLTRIQNQSCCSQSALKRKQNETNYLKKKKNQEPAKSTHILNLKSLSIFLSRSSLPFSISNNEATTSTLWDNSNALVMRRQHSSEDQDNLLLSRQPAAILSTSTNFLFYYYFFISSLLSILTKLFCALTLIFHSK